MVTALCALCRVCMHAKLQQDKSVCSLSTLYIHIYIFYILYNIKWKASLPKVKCGIEEKVCKRMEFLRRGFCDFDYLHIEFMSPCCGCQCNSHMIIMKLKHTDLIIIFVNILIWYFICITLSPKVIVQACIFSVLTIIQTSWVCFRYSCWEENIKNMYFKLEVVWC